MTATRGFDKILALFSASNAFRFASKASGTAANESKTKLTPLLTSKKVLSFSALHSIPNSSELPKEISNNIASIIT